MKNRIFRTDNNNIAATIARIILGAVILPHGLQKAFGWFGGYGFTGTMQFFTDTIGMPWILGFLVIVIEVLGGICLILGLATRLWAISFTVILTGIALTSHIQNGFFMNWFGNQKGEGVEYCLLGLALALGLVFTGGGKLSVDNHVRA